MTSNKLLKDIATKELERRYKWSTSYEEIVKLGRALGYTPKRVERDMPRPQLLNSTVRALIKNYEEAPEEQELLQAFDPDIQIMGESENFRNDLKGKFGYNPRLGMVVPEKQKGAAFVSKKALDNMIQSGNELIHIFRDPNSYTLLDYALKHQGFDVEAIDGIYLERRKELC
jgi:hypothetical protein